MPAKKRSQPTTTCWAELDIKDAIFLDAELKVFNYRSSQTSRGPTPSTMNAKRVDREVDVASGENHGCLWI